MPPKTRNRKAKASTPPQSAATTERRHRHSFSGPNAVSTAESSKHTSSSTHPSMKGTRDHDDDAPPPSITNATHPSHGKQLLAEVSPPGSRISFHKFTYVLTGVAFVMLAWWMYGLVVLVERMKDDVGWWGIIVGDTSGRLRDVTWVDKGWFGKWNWWGLGGRDGERGRREDGVESSLNALADALGISPVEVARAVKPVVPAASVSSLVSRAEHTGEVMKMLLAQTTTTQKETQSKAMGYSEDDVAEEEMD